MVDISSPPLSSTFTAYGTSLKIRFDDENCKRTEDLYREAVWHNGDTLSGTLEVTTPIFDAFDICIVLEGIVKVGLVDIGHNYSLLEQGKVKNQHQFLRICQHFHVDPSSSENLQTHTFAFHFIIPHQLYPSTCSTPQQFLQLPPSIRKSEAIVRMTGDQSFMQPTIGYFVHAKLKPKPAPLPETVTCYNITREIFLRPYNAPAPPLVLEHFPKEFTVACRSPFRLQRWTNDVGELAVAMAEPLPLNLCTSAPRGGTYAVLHVDVLPSLMQQQDLRPEGWSVSVTSWLNVKTFCSTKHSTTVPSYHELETEGALLCESKAEKLERREFHRLAWKYHELPTYSKVGAGTPSIATSIMLPISVPKSTLPTFLTTLVARSYSLKIKVKISGVRHQDLLLEVPLQIINEDVERTANMLEQLPPPELLWSDDTSSESVSLNDDLASPPEYDQCNHHVVVVPAS